MKTMKALLHLLSTATILHSDDLGYGDVSCDNPERGKIPIPHIDKLAARSMCVSPAGTPQKNDGEARRYPR